MLEGFMVLIKRHLVYPVRKNPKGLCFCQLFLAQRYLGLRYNGNERTFFAGLVKIAVRNGALWKTFKGLTAKAVIHEENIVVPAPRRSLTACFTRLAMATSASAR